METFADQPAPPRRLHFEWVLPVLFRPRRALAMIARENMGVWLVPLLILSLTALASVVMAGSIKQAAALASGPELPPDFQYMPPEMQEQYLKAMQATSSPVFLYVFPGIVALGGVWLGWLLVGGLLHLVLTLLGGRGDTGSTLNVVAWSGLPFAVRDLVRTIYMMSTRQLIAAQGVAGFVSSEASGWSAYLRQLLSLMDLYLIWNIVLLIIGVLVSTKLGKARAIGSVVFTVLLLVALEALISFLVAQLSGLTVMRPFY